MEATTKLPERKHFYSKIQEKSISKEEHLFATKVWDIFEIKNLREYAELYCSVDTLILCEVFQKFRKTMLDFCELDPVFYVSLPGLSWDAMLKITDCCIELPTDIDMVYFIESGIRGGLSYINTRYLSTKEEEGKSKSSIRYIDANVSCLICEKKSSL